MAVLVASIQAETDQHGQCTPSNVLVKVNGLHKSPLVHEQSDLRGMGTSVVHVALLCLTHYGFLDRNGPKYTVTVRVQKRSCVAVSFKTSADTHLSRIVGRPWDEVLQLLSPLLQRTTS
jgi:hypothetical protein